MAIRRWTRAALIAAGCAACFAALARAQSGPDAQPSSNSTRATIESLVQRDVQSLRQELERPSPATRPSDEPEIQARRDEAARRLLSRDSLADRTILENVLRNPQSPRDAKVAVARAIADSANPDPAFAGLLLPLLGGERPVHDAITRALGRYGSNPEVAGRLIAFARDTRQPATARLPVIRALGNFIRRDVADALVDLMGAAGQGAAITTQAADALIELTGLSDNDHDLSRWRAWQQANANIPESRWRADVLSSRDARDARLARSQATFIDELKATVNSLYDKSDRHTQDLLMLQFLNSPDPRMRQMGIARVVNAHYNAIGFPSSAKLRLTELVGDSDENVRIAAADAIRALNDPNALEAVLAQLAQEPNATVKVQLIKALVPMRKMEAVPELVRLLHDPSMKVAIAAAKALQELAPLISRDAALAPSVAQSLWQTGNARAAEAGGEAFRAAAIEAVGPLHDPELTRPLFLLLNPNESARVRSAALRALGALADRNTGPGIAQRLNDESDPAVLIDGLDALTATNSFEDAAPLLYNYMSPQVEPDKAVREHAWVDYESKLPSASSVEVLTQEADRFQNDPAKKLFVLIALDDRLQKESKDPALPAQVRDARKESLASYQQTTGELYARLHNPEKAAAYFREALDYWQSRGAANQITLTLVRQLIDALLDSGQYAEATQFAARQIATDPAQQTLVGPEIRNAANTLVNDGIDAKNPRQLRDALKLIDAALEMSPALQPKYQDQLRAFQQQAQSALAGMK